MKETPQFIRKFSKEKSAEERQKVAEIVRAKRKEYFREKRSLTERLRELEKVTSEREKALAEQLESLRRLENEIAELSTSMLKKILNYFRLKKLRADAAIGERTLEELKREQEKELAEQKVISQKLISKEIPPEFQEAKAVVDNFYEEQKEKWARSEYTKEDIMKYFSEEHLASLSLEDYTLLLRRFPGEMVTHVTRQGIRDHIGHMYHTAEVGAYSDSFMRMVKDGRLRSPLGVYLVEKEKEKAIARYLYLDEFKTKEEALNYLATIIKEEWQGEPGSYADRMAIHFATEEVADCYYGSEKGNEIFIAYPSAYIASQYYFSGQLTERGSGYWNDQWVWANEERGIDLNTGIIFIPRDARVDRKTGSRYELDENKNPIKNSEYIKAFRRVVDSRDFHEFAKQVEEITGMLSDRWDSPNPPAKDQELLKKLEPFRQRLEKEFGITDKRLQRAILDFGHLVNIDLRKRDEEEGRKHPYESVDSEIERALKDKGILYKEAKDTISSKEFWDAYFAKNPKKRPSKIVYYRGSSPTRALQEWKKIHRISKKAESPDIGFPERKIKETAPEATRGLDRFKILAEKVIEDYFAQKESRS